MCVSPIRIINPSRDGSISVIGKVSNSFLSDNQSQYILVPCGHCPECVKSRQLFLTQRVQMEALDNYLFFCTLTYANDMIPQLCINGYRHQFAQYGDFQNMVKRFRVHNESESWYRPFRYLVVSEYGSESHRPHFHVIFSVPKYVGDSDFTPYNLEHHFRFGILKEWSRNIASDKCPVYKPLCHYYRRHGNYNYDFHYIVPKLRPDGSVSTSMDVAFYVTKYCLAFDAWFKRKADALRLNCTPDQYHYIMNIIKPRQVMSKGFGNPSSSSVQQYIRKCISISKHMTNRDGYNLTCPCFFNDDGEPFPMSPYFQKRFVTLRDRIDFYYRDNNPETCIYPFNFIPSKEISDSDLNKKNLDYTCLCKHLNNRNTSVGGFESQKISDATVTEYVMDFDPVTFVDSFDDGVFDDLPDFVPPDPVVKLIGIEDTRTVIGFERHWLRRMSELYPFGISRIRPIYGKYNEFQKKFEKIS